MAELVRPRCRFRLLPLLESCLFFSPSLHDSVQSNIFPASAEEKDTRMAASHSFVKFRFRSFSFPYPHGAERIQPWRFREACTQSSLVECLVHDSQVVLTLGTTNFRLRRQTVGEPNADPASLLDFFSPSGSGLFMLHGGLVTECQLE